MKKTTSHSAPVDGAGMNGSHSIMTVTKRINSAATQPLTPRVIAFAAERRLPTMYPFSTVVQNGGPMSYSIDFFEMWRRAASYVDRILKGASPADLPVEQATRGALKINFKTATSLRLTVPPTLLARADE